MSQLWRAGRRLGSPQGGASSPACLYPSDSGRFSSPPLAGMLAESSEARNRSIRSASPGCSRSTRCHRYYTPPSCYSLRRCQQVESEPQPAYLGSISQGMPLFTTKVRPVSAALFDTRRLPPLALGDSGGPVLNGVSEAAVPCQATDPARQAGVTGIRYQTVAGRSDAGRLVLRGGG